MFANSQRVLADAVVLTISKAECGVNEDSGNETTLQS